MLEALRQGPLPPQELGITPETQKSPFGDPLFAIAVHGENGGCSSSPIYYNQQLGLITPVRFSDAESYFGFLAEVGPKAKAYFGHYTEAVGDWLKGKYSEMSGLPESRIGPLENSRPDERTDLMQGRIFPNFLMSVSLTNQREVIDGLLARIRQKREAGAANNQTPEDYVGEERTPHRIHKSSVFRKLTYAGGTAASVYAGLLGVQVLDDALEKAMQSSQIAAVEDESAAQNPGEQSEAGWLKELAKNVSKIIFDEVGNVIAIIDKDGNVVQAAPPQDGPCGKPGYEYHPEKIDVCTCWLPAGGFCYEHGTDPGDTTPGVLPGTDPEDTTPGVLPAGDRRAVPAPDNWGVTPTAVIKVKIRIRDERYGNWVNSFKEASSRIGNKYDQERGFLGFWTACKPDHESQETTISATGWQCVQTVYDCMADTGGRYESKGTECNLLRKGFYPTIP